MIDVPTLDQMAVPLPTWPGAGEGVDRARTTRRSILLAAAHEFARCGYHGATLREITERAGTTKGALYFHFTSKDDLAASIADEIVETVRRQRQEVADRGLDPLWRWLVGTDVAVAQWTADPLSYGVDRWLRTVPGMGARLTSWNAAWERHTRIDLLQARDSGLVVPAVDPDGLARVFRALVTGHDVLGQTQPEGPGLWARVNDSWEQLLPHLAEPAWVARWRASPWERRPTPDPVAFARARGLE